MRYHKGWGINKLVFYGDKHSRNVPNLWIWFIDIFQTI